MTFRPDPSLAELLDFPARLALDLPEPVLLRLQVAGAPVPVEIATYPAALEPPVLADRITFDREEVRALVLGVEADRIWHADFLGMCFEKWRSPGFHLRAADALAGANPDDDRAWSLERVLRRLGATVVELEYASDEAQRSERARREAARRAHARLPAAA
jgi:hypothetical protein